MDTKTRQRVEENTADIADIKTTLVRLETNHIYHIEKDMERQTKQIDKLDTRLWWILGLLVTGIVVPAFINGLM
jgi:hypothetical protein